MVCSLPASPNACTARSNQKADCSLAPIAGSGRTEEGEEMMNRMRMFVVAVLAGVLVAQSLHALEARDVKRATDRAGNWIIEQYDVQEKAYKGEGGKDVKTVAMIIRALCDSPRDYKESNGPYISEPVKFLLAQINDDGRLKNKADDKDTATWVRMALESTKNKKYEELAKKITDINTVGSALSKAELKELSDAYSTMTKEDAKKYAASIADKLMKLQQKNGSFGDNLQTTAFALVTLSLCYRELK
jgi:hypothetical protein